MPEKGKVSKITDKNILFEVGDRIKPRSIIVTVTEHITNMKRGQDDGFGFILGQGFSGTVDYEKGIIKIEYLGKVNNQDISIKYREVGENPFDFYVRADI